MHTLLHLYTLYWHACNCRTRYSIRQQQAGRERKRGWPQHEVSSQWCAASHKLTGAGKMPHVSKSGLKREQPPHPQHMHIHRVHQNKSKSKQFVKSVHRCSQGISKTFKTLIHKAHRAVIFAFLLSLLLFLLHIVGIDFKIKTIELGGKRIKLQIW